MNYRQILPAKSLENIVQFFWEFEGDFSDATRYEHSVTASINPKLAFQYKAGMVINQQGIPEKLFRSGWQGQTSGFYRVSTVQNTGVLGVYFYPYAIPVLFNKPASILTNYNVEIADLLGPEGAELEEKIMLGKDTATRINILTNFIQNKLTDSTTRNNGVISVVQGILASKGNSNVTDLIKNQFVSQRQFERKFKNLTGFSPKMFSRIVRFEACISQAYFQKQSLTQLALASGYYDQAHMIRDFKEFSGQNPGSYFSEDHALFF